jgi:hypothetical protein
MFEWLKTRLVGQQAAADPYEEFVREFVAECQRQRLVPKSYDANTRAFVFIRDDGSEMTYFMHNGFREWLDRDRQGRTELMTRWVASIFDSLGNHELDPDKLPDELVPGIRSHAQISNVLIRNWTAGAPSDDSTATAFQPFAGDLVACVLRDQTNSMAQMTGVNLTFAKLPLDQAMARAMANFHRRIPTPVFEAMGSGLFGSNNLSDHQSAMLLLRPGVDYPLPAIDGTPVAIVPSRNVFYLTGSASTTGLAKALDIAQKANQMGHFLSSAILQWDGSRWVEAELAGELAARQREIRQHQIAEDYNSQKELLDLYHQSKGQDIFVASVLLFRPKNSRELVSVATLASGTTGTLLPHADRLFFGKQVIDPQTGLAQRDPGDKADVAWSDAMAIAGHLFETVPYLYPPRLKALGFPSDDLWTRLKAVAREP